MSVCCCLFAPPVLAWVFVLLILLLLPLVFVFVFVLISLLSCPPHASIVLLPRTRARPLSSPFRCSPHPRGITTSISPFFLFLLQLGYSFHGKNPLKEPPNSWHTLPGPYTPPLSTSLQLFPYTVPCPPSEWCLHVHTARPC